MMAIKPEFPWRRTRKWWRKFVWERRQNSISRLSSILYINKMKIMWKWSNKWNLVSDRVNVDRNQMLPTVEFKRYFAMEDTRKTSKKSVSDEDIHEQRAAQGSNKRTRRTKSNDIMTSKAEQWRETRNFISGFFHQQNSVALCQWLSSVRLGSGEIRVCINSLNYNVSEPTNTVFGFAMANIMIIEFNRMHFLQITSMFKVNPKDFKQIIAIWLGLNQNGENTLK